MLTGKEIAANLEKLFRMFGLPLLLKRDNHGNLNRSEVNGVLKIYFVIPINSPPYFTLPVTKVSRNVYRFDKRERRLIYGWIKSQTWAILNHMKNETHKAFGYSWCIAAETWLHMKSFIFISVNGKVLPNFSQENSHN